MDKWLDQLETDMAAMVSEHEQLLALIRRKKEAMRTARPAEVADLCELENQRVQKIGELEKRRQKTVAALTGAMNPGSKALLTMEQVAERIGEPRRGRLLVRKLQLRTTIEAVKKENDIARLITQGLLKHVQGIVQQVTLAVGAAGTYGRKGVSAAPAVAVSTFAVTG